MPVTKFGDFGPAAALVRFYDLDQTTYASYWDRQTAIYARTAYYFSGTIFDDARTKPQDGSAGELMYPLRINVISRTCIAHALHLWGLTDEGPLLRFTIQPGKSAAKAQKRADRHKTFLDDLWNDETVETLLRMAARNFIKDGGCFLKLHLDGARPQHLAVETILAQHAYPVWNPANFTDLLRIHIVFPIDATVAKDVYGVPVKPDSGLYDYVETWDKEQWAVQIRRGEQSWPAKNGDRLLAGENLCREPDGQPFIPITYIPRLRTDGFYGLNIVDDLRGMQNELNARFADYGDAVTQQTHASVVGHDITARRKNYDGTIELAPGKVTDLGETGPGGKSPELNVLNYGNLTQGVGDLNSDLQDALYDQAGLPPVMRGIDEGSQRSALTLAMRALPTLAMVTDYRAEFRRAIKYLSRAALCISLATKINDVDAAMLEQNVALKFAPVLPKDIDQINQTISIQRSAKVMSRRRALMLSPDVDDIEAEIAELEQEEQEQLDRQMEQQQMQAEQQSQQADVNFARQKELQDQKTAAAVQVAKAKPQPKKGTSQ